MKIKNDKVGCVYRAVTQFIDKDTKRTRLYVIVDQRGKKVAVAKLKSIKKFSPEGKNAEENLVEINFTRYGLTKRTGVDYQVFRINRLKNNILLITDNDVFPGGPNNPEFKLGSHDLNRTLKHTGKVLRKKKR